MVKPSYRITDTETMRALAHPLRQRIMMELSVRRSARAADLAEIIGEPANALSYHLRALAKAKLIVEAPELARDTRDRVWQMVHPEGVYVPPDADNPAIDVAEEQYLSWIRSIIQETLPENPRATRGRYLGAALLTKAESRELFMELAEVLERWREHGMDAAATDPHNPDRVFHYLTALVGNRAEDSDTHVVEPGATNQSTTSVS